MGKETSERIQTSLLNAAEKKALVWLAQRQPSWVTSDFLTYTGLLGAVICAVGFVLAHIDKNYLWLSSLGLFINWYGDSLDGTLARVRNTQRPVYGFFIDHSLDAITICIMCIGAGLSPMFRLDVAMLVLAGQDLNREQSITAAALMALYPFSFFALGIYTESLFLLLCLLCMITARRQNWLWAGVWGALAALCRNQGLVLILPLLYLWLRARREKKQGLVSLCILFPLLGWGSYLALNARLFGDPFAFLEFQAAPPWYQSIKWIGINLVQHWQMALKYPGLAPFIYHAQLVLYFAAMALLFIGFCRKAPTHWLIWGGAYLGMCYLAGWLISGGRYVFGCLPLYLIGSSLPRPARWALLVISGFFFWKMGVYYMQGQAIM